MALEKSVLSENLIRDIMKRYGLTMLAVRKLSLGSANCFAVQCAEGTYFLKEYQSEISRAEVEREAAVTEYLAGKDFPVARFLKTVEGEVCIEVEGHILSVQKYIEGETYLNDLPKPLFKESAKYLGMLHSALKDFPMERGMDEKWLASFSVEDAVAKFDKLLGVIPPDSELLPNGRTDAVKGKTGEESGHNGIRDVNLLRTLARIRADLTYKKELVRKLPQWKQYFEGITYTPTHGDYTACQLICDGDKVKAVIDFSAAMCLPAVWEIMRSYVQSGGACRDGAPFDTADFVSYVREYRKYAPLTERDLTAMPYVYLYQLSQSSYGYKEFLVTKSENRNDLLRFAFWRTDICREIERKAAEISEALGAT